MSKQVINSHLDIAKATLKARNVSCKYELRTNGRTPHLGELLSERRKWKKRVAKLEDALMWAQMTRSQKIQLEALKSFLAELTKWANAGFSQTVVEFYATNISLSAKGEVWVDVERKITGVGRINGKCLYIGKGGRISAFLEAARATAQNCGMVMGKVSFGWYYGIPHFHTTKGKRKAQLFDLEKYM